MADVSVKEAIINYITAKLEANSYGIKFQVFVDILIEGERYRILSKNTTTDTEEEIDYIPVVIDLEETPTGNPTTDKSTWRMSLTYSLAAFQADDDEDFLNQKRAIEELRRDIRFDPYTFFVIDNADQDNINYDVAFKPTSLSSFGEIPDQAGELRPIKVMSIAIQSGIGLSFADVDEIYEIERDANDELGDFDLTVLDYTTVDDSVGIEYNQSQKEDDENSIGVPNRAIRQVKMTLDLDKTLLAHQYLWLKTKGLRPWDDIINLKVTTKLPLGDVEETRQVNVQGTRIGRAGDASVLSLTFTEAEN